MKNIYFIILLLSLNYLNAQYTGGTSSGFIVCQNLQNFNITSLGGVSNGESLCMNLRPSLPLFKGAVSNGEAMCFTPDFPLPVTLKDFNAKCMHNYIEINWSTLSEQNNDYFILSKSNDGINWKQLDTIKGAGNSNSLKYYSSKAPYHRSITYYRLIQVDYDGEKEYHNIISANCKDSAPISIFPNPTNGHFYIKTNMEIIGDLLVTNSLGKTVAFSNVSNDGRYDISRLSNGIYFIKIQTTKGEFIYKIILKK